MKIAVFSTKSYDKTYFEQFTHTASHSFTYFDATLNDLTAKLTIGFDAVCLFVNDVADRKTIVLMAANGVRLIALRCAGFNNVDLQAAAENHIKVVRVPAYSPQAVAEHAVALIMALNRKIHKVYNRVREGNFSLERLIGFNLFQKTVGVVGTGKIGAAFCAIMQGFGCKVIAHDIFESDDLKSKSVEYVSFDELLSRSDIISLHCPLTPETRHLFDAAAFAAMKKGAMLVNTGRGALINAREALAALRTGQLGYLGLDVYEQEEHIFFKDLSESIIEDDLIERLLSFHNVLITPHQGFFTDEALKNITETTFKNITDFENGAALENEIAFKPPTLSALK